MGNTQMGSTQSSNTQMGIRVHLESETVSHFQEWFLLEITLITI